MFPSPTYTRNAARDHSHQGWDDHQVIPPEPTLIIETSGEEPEGHKEAGKDNEGNGSGVLSVHPRLHDREHLQHILHRLHLRLLSLGRRHCCDLC